MSFTDRIVDFIQKGERLIIVTWTIALAGVACAVAERFGLMSFEGLPSWARPTAQLMWAISAAHVAIHATISAAHGARWIVKWLRALPEKRRQAVYESAIVERLLNIGALEREMICYALYKSDNHIWTDDTDRPPAWTLNLRTAGLIDVSDAQWGAVHYKIHPVAWNLHAPVSHEIFQCGALAKCALDFDEKNGKRNARDCRTRRCEKSYQRTSSQVAAKPHF